MCLHICHHSTKMAPAWRGLIVGSADRANVMKILNSIRKHSDDLAVKATRFISELHFLAKTSMSSPSHFLRVCLWNRWKKTVQISEHKRLDFFSVFNTDHSVFHKCTFLIFSQTFSGQSSLSKCRLEQSKWRDTGRDRREWTHVYR